MEIIKLVGCRVDCNTIQHHDSLRKALFFAAQSAALTQRSEVPSRIHESKSQPADHYLQKLKCGMPAALDISVNSSFRQLTVVVCWQTWMSLWSLSSISSQLWYAGSPGCLCELVPPAAHSCGMLAHMDVSVITTTISSQLWYARSPGCLCDLYLPAAHSCGMPAAPNVCDLYPPAPHIWWYSFYTIIDWRKQGMCCLRWRLSFCRHFVSLGCGVSWRAEQWAVTKIKSIGHLLDQRLWIPQANSTLNSSRGFTSATVRLKGVTIRQPLQNTNF